MNYKNLFSSLLKCYLATIRIDFILDCDQKQTQFNKKNTP